MVTKNIAIPLCFLASCVTNVEASSDIWQKLSCGAMTDIGDGVVELVGTDYRMGNTAVSRALYDFTQGSETLIQFMPIDNDYSGFGAGIGVASIGGTTGYSFEDSTFLTSGTWYYARITVNKDRTYNAVLSTENYDTAGGTPIKSQSGTLTDVQWASAKVSQMYVGFGDNYSGTNSKVHIGKATTTAVLLPALSGTEVVYNFNDGKIPADFKVVSGDWSAADQTLKLVTSGNQTSPVELPLKKKALQVSFRVKTDIILRSWGWDSGFGFSYSKDTVDFGGQGWNTTPSNSCWMDVSFPLPKDVNTLRWTYNETNYYSGSPSPQKHQVAIDDVRVLYANVGGSSDITVTSITLNPVSPIAGTPFSAKVTVKNQGTASGNSDLAIWTDKNKVQACKATGDKSAAVGTLAAGASKTLTFTDLKVASAGTKIFRAFVDANCATAESDENNNQLTAAYRVKADMPDFLATSVTLNPAVPSANSSFTATVTVSNQGTTAVDAGYLDVWANTRSTVEACGDEGDAWIDVGVLAAGTTKSFQVTLPAGMKGAKTLRTFIDSWCETLESNEINNQFTIGYKVN